MPPSATGGRVLLLSGGVHVVRVDRYHRPQRVVPEIHDSVPLRSEPRSRVFCCMLATAALRLILACSCVASGLCTFAIQIWRCLVLIHRFEEQRLKNYIALTEGGFETAIDNNL